MSYIQRIVTRLIIAFVLAAASLGATGAAPLGAQPMAASQGTTLLVGLKPGTSLRVDNQGVSASDGALAQSVSALGVQAADTVFHGVTGSGRVSLAGLAGPIDLRAVYKLRLPAGANVAAALGALRANPAVVYAEPDAIAHLITTPNDPLYAQQWGLAQIGAPAAWSVSTGSASVAIAVIDTGLDTTHPDLAGQLWTNPGEIASNGVDDDNDGHIDDINGWNFLGDNADLSDNSGHGTEVAGIAAAATNNGAGVAGVCWACKLMVVKVAQPSGVANYSDIAAGVNYAAQKGAKVINLSLGGNSDSITLRAAVSAAAATAVIVGGAGNDNSSALFYPAAYPEVLAVAGTTATDTKVADSNFGAWVSVTAPGEAITTTFSGGGYGASSGTSLAAPFAAGLAGLLFSQHPDWSPAQVRAQIVHTAHNIDAQNPSHVGQLGSGRIDAGQAVATAAHPVVSLQSISVNGQSNGTPAPGTVADVSLTLYDDWGTVSNLQATLTGGGPHASVLSGTVSYGTLGAYQSAANTGTLRINIAGAAGYGASLPFMLNLTGDGGFAASLPVTIATAPSTTYEHGTLSTQTWTPDRLYVIDNNASIAAGQVLTIEPGTTVQFAGNYSLSVAGTLIADGTAQQPIRFARQPTAANWSSIQFLASSVDATYDSSGHYTGGSIIRHAVIDGSSNSGTAGISLVGAGPYLAGNSIASGGINGAGRAGLVIAGNALTATQISVSVGDQIIDNSVTLGGINAQQFNLVARNQVSQANCGVCVTQVTATTANRVDHSVIGLSASGGWVTDNLLASDSTGLSISGAAMVLSNTVLYSGNTDVEATSAAMTLHGNNLLAASGHYALRNDAGAPVSTTGNWWGTSDNSAIEALIYDDQKDATKSSVDHSGYLSGPVQGAPAYVQSVGIQPDSTLGIQTGTFEVQFSRPMDQDLNPTASFSSVESGHWITYTSSNSSLPNGYIFDMAADKDGSVWVATSVGVVQTNGLTWKIYDTSNSGLPSNFVNSLTIDAKGVKWFISDQRYLVSFDGADWKTWDMKPAGLFNPISLAVDADGSVWVGTSGFGAGHLQGATWTVQDLLSPINGMAVAFNRIVIDSKGVVWLVSEYTGVARVAGSSVTTYTTGNSAVPSNNFQDLAIDANGVKWFGSFSGLMRFDDQTWTTYTPANSQIPSNNVESIAFDADGRMWLGFGGSVAHQADVRWVTYPQPCTRLVYDANKKTWCISATGNVSGKPASISVTGNDKIYPIVDNGHWLDATHWQATYDFTSLLQRGAYSLGVTSASGLDGVEIAADTSTTFTVDYAGTVTDKTPPPQPWIFAEGTTGNPSNVTARWTATDPNSSIINYRYAIGSAPGAVDVVNWTTLAVTAMTRSGLGLVAGHHYWVSLQAQNQGGLWSPVAASQFTAGAANPKVFLPVLRR